MVPSYNGRAKSERDRRTSRATEDEVSSILACKRVGGAVHVIRLTSLRTCTCQPSTPWTWSDGTEHQSQAAARLWVCNVCRRENQGGVDTCAVCFTKKDYKPQKLNNISPNASRTTSPTGGVGAANVSSRRDSSDTMGGDGRRSRSPPPNGAEDVEEIRRRAARNTSRSGTNCCSYSSVVGFLHLTPHVSCFSVGDARSQAQQVR